MTLASHLAKDARLAARDWKGVALVLALPVVILGVYALLDLRELSRSGRSPDAFILVLSSALPALLMASGTLVQERRLGTLPRLARSPANLFAFLASKSLSASALFCAQALVILGAAAALLPEGGPAARAHPFLVLVLVLLTALASHALGLLLSALAATETQASQLAALAFLLMMTLSGFLVRLADVPRLGAVSGWLPVALGYAGLEAVLKESAGGGEPLALLNVTLVLLLLAGAVCAWRARRAAARP